MVTPTGSPLNPTRTHSVIPERPPRLGRVHLLPPRLPPPLHPLQHLGVRRAQVRLLADVLRQVEQPGPRRRLDPLQMPPPGRLAGPPLPAQLRAARPALALQPRQPVAP